MNKTVQHILLINESPHMIRSVKAVLIRDGYIVQVCQPSSIKDKYDISTALDGDALEIIRKVRNEFPKMSNVILIPQSSP